MNSLNNIATENNDILSDGVELKHIVVGGKLFQKIKHYENLSLKDIDGEIWKDVVGYEGLYQISNFGRVKSLTKKINNGAVRKESIKKQMIDYSGYLKCSLNKNLKSNNFGVHRLVAIAFIPNPKNKPIVNHKKGIKTDNRVSELEWNTESENVNHAYANGLSFYKKKGISPFKREKTTNEKDKKGVYKTYMILSPITNNIVYIGYTKHTTKRRLRRHITDNIGNIGKWCNEIVKLGLYPIIKIIENFSCISEAYRSETFHITKYKNEGFQLLNKTFGKGSTGVPSGMLGKKHPKVRSGIYHPLYGKRLTEEQKQNIRKYNLGKKRTLESRNKQSKSLIGHSCSQETRKKMSLNNASSKKIVQLDIDNNLIKVWDSIKIASDELKINYSTMRAWVQNKLKRIGKKCKYKFTYLSHYNEIKHKLIIKNKKE